MGNSPRKQTVDNTARKPPPEVRLLGEVAKDWLDGAVNFATPELRRCLDESRYVLGLLHLARKSKCCLRISQGQRRVLLYAKLCTSPIWDLQGLAPPKLDEWACSTAQIMRSQSMPDARKGGMVSIYTNRSTARPAPKRIISASLTHPAKMFAPKKLDAPIRKQAPTACAAKSPIQEKVFPSDVSLRVKTSKSHRMLGLSPLRCIKEPSKKCLTKCRSMEKMYLCSKMVDDTHVF